MTPHINKQEFPTLPKDVKPQKDQMAKSGGEEGGGGGKEVVVTKKGRKKNKGHEIVDWNKLNKIDYNSMF